MKLAILILSWFILFLIVFAFVYGAFKIVVPPVPKPKPRKQYDTNDETVIF